MSKKKKSDKSWKAWNKYLKRNRQKPRADFRNGPSKEITVFQDCESTCRPTDRQVFIFKSEMDFISRCIMDYPDIETGGQLFGYFSESGTPLVVYAIGPGPKANHQVTFFNQDLDYLVKTGRCLKDSLGLHHIGEWHSHHKMGLARPSGHDAHTMISTIREKNLGTFLLCIGNIRHGRPTFTPFLCDDRKYVTGSWDIICGDNPFRRVADRLMQEFVSLPHTAPSVIQDEHQTETPASPTYVDGYWLAKKANHAVLHDICTFLMRNKGLHARQQVKLVDGLVCIVSSHNDLYGRDHTEEVLFPAGFPESAPVIRRWVDGEPVQIRPAGWHDSGMICEDFVMYYNKTIL